jgi:wyosine [tRNA(Phe)-imidazoG37] synthetase (radical SAM superfamily)
MPFDFKICSFDCLYCQYGWTEYHTNMIEKFVEMPSVEQVSAALEQALINYKEQQKNSGLIQYPLYITFSGNGEPTLHQEFSQIVDSVIEVRNRISPSSKTAILSNSTTISNPTVRTALTKLDVRIMKLDAGNDNTFHSYNNPAKGIDLEDITEGLSALNDITIQTLFTGGKMGNYNDVNISDWIKRLKRISPIKVQLYSLDRGYPSEDITPIEKDKLLKVKSLLDRENIFSEVYER